MSDRLLACGPVDVGGNADWLLDDPVIGSVSVLDDGRLRVTIEVGAEGDAITFEWPSGAVADLPAASGRAAA